MSDEITPIRIEQRRLFDWRLVISLIAAGLLVYGSFASVKAIQANEHKDHNTAVALTEVAAAQAQVHELISLLKAESDELKAKDVADEANLVRFATNQRRMLDFQAAEIAWTRRILNFIRTHPGQQVPASFLDSPNPPVLLRISAPKSGRKKAVTPKHGARKGNPHR